MNFLEGCKRLRQDCGGSGSGPSSVENQVDESKQFVDWYNQAYLEILLLRPSWNFLWARGTLSLLTGIDVYSLPSPTVELESFRLSGNGLVYQDFRDFRHVYHTPQTAKPGIFTIQPDGQLRFNSLPDADYSVTYEYYRKPVALTKNDEVPLLPERFHMLIVYKAMQFYAAYENAPEVMQAGVAQYEEMLTRMTRDELPKFILPGPLA